MKTFGACFGTCSVFFLNFVAQNQFGMSETSFYLLLEVMSAVALCVFIALYFVKAGYGMFRTSSWGFSIDNKLAWVLMEAPVFFVMLGLWIYSGVGVTIPEFVFLVLFLLHYFQRSFVFPLLMKGKSRMPIAIMAMGIVFNLLNGMMQAGGIFFFPSEGMYADGWAYFLRPWAIPGVLLFFLGMGINLHSDHVIRHLRQPGDTKHYLPAKGFYRVVTSANYFGELLEWTGFAVLTASPAAWVFVWWTFANLVPRANAIHRRYREEFGDEAVGKRKRIIPFLY